MTDLQKRFYRHVNPIKSDKECLEWVGAKNEWGYGRFSYKGKNRIAPRIAWILEKGEIPNNLWVLHKCDNPACVNIEHLFLGTHQDNMTDMVVKGRHGTRVNHKFNVKLKLEEVIFIKNSSISNRKLARKFNVSDSLICQIRKGMIWKEVN